MLIEYAIKHIVGLYLMRYADDDVQEMQHSRVYTQTVHRWQQSHKKLKMRSMTRMPH